MRMLARRPRCRRAQFPFRVTGQALYRRSDGTWTFEETESGVKNVKMFTIDAGSGEIKTATDFGKLQNLPSSLAFTIRAYRFQQQ